MVRKLKFHEQKLLKKVDFISWKVDNNLNEVKVMKKYYVQKREDYTKWVTFLRLISFFSVLYFNNKILLKVQQAIKRDQRASKQNKRIEF